MRRFAILALASVALAGCNSNMAANNASAAAGDAGNAASPAGTNAANMSGDDVPLGSAGPAETAAPAGNEATAAPAPPPPPPPTPAPPPPPPPPPSPPMVTMAAPPPATSPPPPPEQQQQTESGDAAAGDDGAAPAPAPPPPASAPPPPASAPPPPGPADAPAPAPAPAAAADPLVYCDVSNDRIRASECAYNREAFARLDPGRAALDVPQRMTRGEPVQVSLALTRATEGRPREIEDPQEHLDTKAEVTRSVRVGRRMGVMLQGEGFTIAPQGLIERDLLAGDAARWDWTVTPTRGGPGRLTATAYAIVTAANGRRTERLLRAFHEDVEIDVGIGDRTRDIIKDSKGWLELSTEWLVALTALIGTGLFGLVLAIRKFRRRPAGGGGGSGGAEGGGGDGGEGTS
jgi:hypothetical protein